MRRPTACALYMCYRGARTPAPLQVSVGLEPSSSPVRGFATDRVMNDCCPALQHSSLQKMPGCDSCSMQSREVAARYPRGIRGSCVFTGCRNALTCHSINRLSWQRFRWTFFCVHFITNLLDETNISTKLKGKKNRILLSMTRLLHHIEANGRNISL